MLSLLDLANLAKERVAGRVAAQMRKQEAPMGMVMQENATYNERLLSSCNLDNIKIDKIFLVALPEKLFSKIAYLSIGHVRNRNTTAQTNGTLRNSDQEYLESLLLLDKEVDTGSLKSIENKGEISELLLCHGLSPMSDSIALIAEMGRLLRMSVALKLPIRIMLADISWMSSNRSIRQIDSLSAEQIDNGLRICLDKRTRVYKALDLQIDLKEIAFLDRVNTISGKKLRAISSNYIRLAKAIWGEKASGRLEYNTISYIKKSLYEIQNIPELENSSLPEHMKIFAKFPKILSSLDADLHDHLQILRAVAVNFNSFEEDVFTYFFAQYYAQKDYVNRFLKIAPISEAQFDKPFDDLRTHFERWDQSSVPPSGLEQSKKETKLPAIYLPQYKIGKYNILPYSPLSLDIIKGGITDHTKILNDIILLEGGQSDITIKAILLETELVHRNRLMADILSFLMVTSNKIGIDLIDRLSNAQFDLTIEEILASINQAFKTSYSLELEALSNAGLDGFWDSWFKGMENDHGNFTPTHIRVMLLTREDWEQNCVIDGFVKIIRIIILVYKELTS